MPWIRVREKSIFQSRIFWTGCGLALMTFIAAAFLAPVALERRRAASATGATGRAAALFAKNDFAGALAEARRALDLDNGAVEAMRIIAKTMESLGDPEALEWRRRIAAIRPGDAENLLARAEAAIAEGDVSTTDEMLGRLRPEDRASARFHELKARAALGRKDAAAAEENWKEAVRLEPNDERHRLSLSTLQLSSAAPGARAGALAVLAAMAGKPATRLAARRALLEDAARTGDPARAREFAKMLRDDPEAAFADKVRVVATLLALKDAGAEPLLAELKKSAATNPDDLYQLLDWMNRDGSPKATLAWIATLPARIVSKTPACLAVAEAFANDAQWLRLKGDLLAASWGDFEYLRFAFLARALARLDDEARSATAWESALTSAERRQASLEKLARTVISWGWQEKVEETLWKMAEREFCPRWALNELWSIATKRGDSAKLFRVSRKLSAADPRSIMHRNNLAFLGLLRREGEGGTYDEMAAQLYEEAPNNSVVASTHALSLYQQGKLQEALSVMNLLKPGELRRPQVALYHGIFLAAAGQREKAGEFLTIGAGGPLLPEEQSLLAQAKDVPPEETANYTRKLNEAAAAESGELVRLVEWMNSHDLGPLVSNWAPALAPGVALKPPVAAGLAEAHAIAANWKRLRDATETTSWADLDYLRNFYLALALDRLGSTAASSLAWKTSLAAAEKDAASLEKLARTIQKRGWEQKIEEVLWKLSGEPRCPEWAIQALWNLSLKRAGAERLATAGRLMAGSDPLKIRARNNALVLGLLARENEGAIRGYVGNLFNEAPDNASLAAIHALALHQQGRTLQAMAVMAGCDAGALREPAAAFYYAVFLTASGHDSQAQEYLSQAGKDFLSPEEGLLLTRARSSR